VGSGEEIVVVEIVAPAESMTKLGSVNVIVSDS